MNPQVELSWGELIDKITILEIKAERLSSDAARANVRRELAALQPVAAPMEAAQPGLAALKTRLRTINETLWQVEDDIRAREAQKLFDAEFIRLARAVYETNDARGRVKQAINRLLGSGLVEEKQYTAY